MTPIFPPRSGRTAAVLGLVTAVTLLAGGVAADPPADPPANPPAKADTPPPAETPPPKQEEPAKKADPPPSGDAPPSLDELLGIGGEEKQEAESDAATDESDVDPPPTTTGDAALDAALGQESMDDMFQLALDGMRRAAARLGERRTDIDTQRTQEEVMRRLEMLIDQAQQQQQQQQSSSSSSSQQRQQQQQQDPGQQQSRAEAEQQQQNQQSQGGSQPAGEGLPPGFEDGERDGVLSEAGSEWGNLPERIRDMLLQGRNERFSSLYERLTRSYYRRLAEEGSQ